MCENISQLLRPIFTGQSWSKPMPSWSPSCFSLGIGVFQASQCNPTKIPTSQKEEDFEGQDLGSASKSGTLVHFNVCSSKSCGCASLLFFCKHVLCTTLKSQIPHLSPVFKKQPQCHSAKISLYQYSTGQQPKDFCAAGRIYYKKLFSRLIIQFVLLKVRLCYILIKDPFL